MDSLVKFLASLSQGIVLDREKVVSDSSAIVFEFVQLMYNEGLIHSCRRNGGKVEVWLKRYKGFSLMRDVKLVSKRGKSVFCTVEELKLLRGVGLYIVSTVEGIMTHKKAILRGLGGKVFCVLVI